MFLMEDNLFINKRGSCYKRVEETDRRFVRLC